MSDKKRDPVVSRVAVLLERIDLLETSLETHRHKWEAQSGINKTIQEFTRNFEQRIKALEGDEERG